MAGPVLVVEDSPTIRRVIASMLQGHGYEALVAADAAQALELLRTHEAPLTALLVDVVMPQMQGPELCKQLRADPKHKALPVVLMSAAESRLAAAAEVNATPLRKPFDGAALRGAIDEAIQQQRPPPSRPPASRPPSRPGSPPGRSPSSPQIPISKPTLTSRSPSVVTIPDTATPASAIEAVSPLPALDTATLAELTEAMLGQLGGRGWYRRAELEQAAAVVLAQHLAGQLIEAPPMSSGGPREVLRGVADAVPLGEVMQVLQMQMQTGVLHVRRGEGVEVQIFFHHGLVDLVAAQGASDEFLVGRYLLEDGVIERDALDEALSSSRAAGKLLGDELVARELVTRDQLVNALMRQSSELIYEVLRWNGAQYVFLRDKNPPRGSDAALGLPVASLVMEGFRRVDEWRVIEENLPPGVVLMRDEVSIDRMGKGRLSRLEKRILDAIDGQRSVQEILDEASASSFEGSKILYQFIQSRLVRRRTS